MAAGELWIDSATGALLYRDYTNTTRSIAGTLDTVAGTAGEIWVSSSIASRLYWQPATGNRRYVGGALVSTGASPAGQIYVSSTLNQLRFVGFSGGLYRVSGT